MSFWVAGAVVVSTGINAYSADKASDQAAAGQKKGMEQSLAITNQARQDVMKLFERSAANSGMGMKAALDYYKTAAPKRMTPYLQGSQQAQQVIGQGAVQANNAILGLPVDMGFVNQPQIVPGTDHMIGAQIPVMDKSAAFSDSSAPLVSGNNASGQPSAPSIGDMGKKLLFSSPLQDAGTAGGLSKILGKMKG